MKSQSKDQPEEVAQESTERLRGRVVWFSAERGFGFIKPEGWKTDIFVHFSQLQMGGHKYLEPYQVVEFRVAKHRDKLQANDVVVIEEGDDGGA